MNEIDPEVENSLRLWSDPAQLLQVVMAAPDDAQRKSRMAWLKNERATLYPVVLGLMYDICAYRVGDTVFRDDAPEEMHDMYFVATTGSDFPDSPGIPLADSFEDAYRVACETLALESLFDMECEVGHRLPRSRQMAHAAA